MAKSEQTKERVYELLQLLSLPPTCTCTPFDKEERTALLTELTDLFTNIGGTVVAWALLKHNIIKPKDVENLEGLVHSLLYPEGVTVH